jgi:hypothetical protein
MPPTPLVSDLRVRPGSTSPAQPSPPRTRRARGRAPRRFPPKERRAPRRPPRTRRGAFAVVGLGDNVGVSPICTRLERDEQLLRDAVQERVEALRFELPEDIRAEVEAEERLLAALLARIEERRAA